MWRPGHLSIRAYTGALLQHAWIWLFSTSLCYSCLRYVHRGHSGYCIRRAPCLEGSASWLPRLWESKDCVQRRAYILISFCERPFDWGDCLFTSCMAFAKGPRFLNMVMTFVLHPLSHYNSIIEPYARFLLSLLEHLTIDFPSHFILSIIDVYRDIATHDSIGEIVRAYMIQC